MAIFGKNRAQQPPGNGTTVIAAGTQLVGNLALSDNLHVDGRIDGDVDSGAGVVIGADGHVEGHVKARNVVVSGRIHGSVAAERLEIISGGVVEGDVRSIDLVIEPGGRFNGSSEILASGDADAERRSATAIRSEAETRSKDRREDGRKRGNDADGTGSVSAA